MAISISQSAAKEIARIKSSYQQPDSPVRLEVKTGGCFGLMYNLRLESQINSGDRLYEVGEICLIVDPQSNCYLEDLKLDYSEDLMGGGFRFQNSRTSETCSCGLSFVVKQSSC